MCCNVDSDEKQDATRSPALHVDIGDLWYHGLLSAEDTCCDCHLLGKHIRPFYCIIELSFSTRQMDANKYKDVDLPTSGVS